MPIQQKRLTKQKAKNTFNWSDNTELVGLVFELSPQRSALVYPQYTIGLHAWFLDQVRSIDSELSAYLHDGESEKPFTLSGLEGLLLSSGKQLQLQSNQTYKWYVTALSQRVVRWLKLWLEQLPQVLELRNAPLQINKCSIALPPTTYAELFQTELPKVPTLTLSFLTPTSFRRKGHHMPLPVPVNVFHSYLRRWNDFSDKEFDINSFLEWVDENVIIYSHQLESIKVPAGKKGSVTGFTGAIEFGLSQKAQSHTEYTKLFYSLGQLAPYCGTGHKTTFGLGQTRLGWLAAKESAPPVPLVENLLAQRIAQLTEILMSSQKRAGGSRAQSVCETRATILARREMGESLQAIAQDLEMPYETVKTYAKLARRALTDLPTKEIAS
jgi:CRISPR-associated endoribonuclease Cas6